MALAALVVSLAALVLSGLALRINHANYVVAEANMRRAHHDVEIVAFFIDWSNGWVTLVNRGRADATVRSAMGYLVRDKPGRVWSPDMQPDPYRQWASLGGQTPPPTLEQLTVPALGRMQLKLRAHVGRTGTWQFPEMNLWECQAEVVLTDGTVLLFRDEKRPPYDELPELDNWVPPMDPIPPEQPDPQPPENHLG